MAGVPFMAEFNDKLDGWAAKNPFVSSGNADVLSCIPFIILIVLLYLVGREILLAPKTRKA